jgi:glycine/D-amino acid oxidase-like deaminating enzyme
MAMRRQHSLIENDLESADAVVIGAGFYGVSIALYLARAQGMGRVIIVDRESEIMSRASKNNQARVHGGYHYPRNFRTANRTRQNFPKFVSEFSEAIDSSFTKLYAIASRNSKITAKQFRRFVTQIGAPLREANPYHRALFSQNMVEEVFQAEEYVFNHEVLCVSAIKELEDNGVRVMLDTEVLRIEADKVKGLIVSIQSQSQSDARRALIHSGLVFNCSYSGLASFEGGFSSPQLELKHEIAEVALIQVPAELRDLGITVMDGPFWSALPFPSKGLHSLSHVRYTPHKSWKDQAGKSPYSQLADYSNHSRYDRMVRDASRFVPSLAGSSQIESLFEIKTVLSMNEENDGRPILFEEQKTLEGCVSILGGKLDNIYDVFEKLDLYFS